jgi:uncharacterized protein (TIGR02117 family)
MAWLTALLVSACAAPTVERQGSEDAAGTKRVFIVHDKWHAAVVARTLDIAPDVMPELLHFPGAEYIEFSWGDADFFPAADAGVGLALKAAFWSRGSVLHLVGFSGTVRNQYPRAAIIEIGLETQELQRLISFISGEFKRDTPRGAAAFPGLFPHSLFFSATSKFSVLRTCNTWVAEAFVAAGLPLRPGLVFTAGNLAGQITPFAIRTEAPAKTVGQAPQVLVKTLRDSAKGLF